MTLIYKYDLPADAGEFSLDMPNGADILHVAAVNDTGALWAAVVPENVPERRRFVSIVTGQQPPENGAHLGTYTILNGRVAIHVFEIQQAKP